MPKRSQPKSDLERSLFSELEKQFEVRVAAKRIARAIERLTPAQGEEAIEIVLHALRASIGEPTDQPLN